MDVFFEKCRKGGGSFPIQKITLQILLVSKRYILVVFSGKKAQCNFQKGTGGGSRPFGNFPKKHPYLGRRSSLRSWTNIANKKLQQKLERNQEIKLWTNLKKCLTKSKRKSYISGPTIILIFSFKYISQKVAFRRRQISLQIFLIFNNKTLLWQNTGSARYFYELFLCCFMLFNVLREGLPS